ncbi:MAG: SCP2 sterol-binding domain-containing protein [Gemmatimonadetes bacterium]|nr:SCP2 sterol-binding domain-containing protein [Gemmatimonadota bacterium]
MSRDTGRRDARSVSFTFPFADWVAAYGTAINASSAYQAASAEWTHGAVALVVNGRPEIGLSEPVGIWLELERGVCHEARLVTVAEAQRAPFVITADYARWKEIVKKELAPIAGILQRKLMLQGSLAIVVRFMHSAEELVNAATTVPTRFLDE